MTGGADPQVRRFPMVRPPRSFFTRNRPVEMAVGNIHFQAGKRQTGPIGPTWFEDLLVDELTEFVVVSLSEGVSSEVVDFVDESLVGVD